MAPDHSSCPPALGALLACFILCCLPLVWSDRTSNHTNDEVSFHLPAVRQIAENWPRLDLTKDSLSATAPGYHYALATLAQGFGTSTRALRLVNLAVSAATLVLLWYALPGGTVARWCLLLPLAASNFVVKSASFVVTDNAALLLTTLTLTLLLCPTPGAKTPVASGLLAAAAVFIRQSNAWLILPLIASLGERRSPGVTSVAWLALLPPIVALVLLVYAWGGLLPPAWSDVHLGLTGSSRFSGAAYLLAVAALLVPPYLAALGGWRAVRPGLTRWTTTGLLGGLLLAMLGPTTHDPAAGRWGGYFWDATHWVPAWADRSLLFLWLAPIGGVALARLVQTVWHNTARSEALIWTTALAAWAAAALVNQQQFHRYYEPGLLVFVILGLALVLKQRPTPIHRGSLVALALLQLALTVVTAHGRHFGLL